MTQPYHCFLYIFVVFVSCFACCCLMWLHQGPVPAKDYYSPNTETPCGTRRLSSVPGSLRMDNVMLHRYTKEETPKGSMVRTPSTTSTRNLYAVDAPNSIETAEDHRDPQKSNSGLNQARFNRHRTATEFERVRLRGHKNPFAPPPPLGKSLDDVLRNAVVHGMDVLLVSHGGVGSNNLANYFERSGVHVKTGEWHNKLCHYQEPPLLKVLPGEDLQLKMAIYLFGDPISAICSMKRQQNAVLNLEKLSNGRSQPYSDKALLRAMYRQFKAWTNPALKTSYSIVVIHFEQSFDSNCIHNIFFKLQRSNRGQERIRFGRHSSDRSKCLSSLDLDVEDITLADEMNNFRSHSAC